MTRTDSIVVLRRGRVSPEEYERMTKLLHELFEAKSADLALVVKSTQEELAQFRLTGLNVHTGSPNAPGVHPPGALEVDYELTMKIG